MNILMIHNRYKRQGGEDVSTQAEAAALRDLHHSVTLLEADNSSLSASNGLATGAAALWSRNWYHRVRASLSSGSYDVVHVQNFFPLVSPSVYYAASTGGVPLVQTLRNFRLICPAATLFRAGDDCLDCVGRAFPWPSIRHACYRSSRPATAVIGAMSSLHSMVGTWDRKVDHYITPSRSAKEKFVKAGWDPDRIVVKPNTVHPDPGPGAGEGGFSLFAGRLVPEKGIRTLLRVWCEREMPTPLVVAGDGPLRDVVERAQAQSGTISWMGHQEPRALYRLMADAAHVIVPSEWPEVGARVPIEALAVGTPVVVADRGALPELARQGPHVQVFEAGVDDALEMAVQRMTAVGEAARQSAREVFLSNYSGAIDAKRLTSIYRQVIGQD